MKQEKKQKRNLNVKVETIKRLDAEKLQQVQGAGYSAMCSGNSTGIHG
jgi:hypothetical protein